MNTSCRRSLGIETSQKYNQTSLVYSGYLSPVHWGTILKCRGLKGSAADVLVPDTRAEPVVPWLYFCISSPRSQCKASFCEHLYPSSCPVTERRGQGEALKTLDNLASCLEPLTSVYVQHETLIRLDHSLRLSFR